MLIKNLENYPQEIGKLSYASRVIPAKVSTRKIPIKYVPSSKRMGLSNAGGVDKGLGVWSRDEYFKVLEFAPIIIIPYRTKFRRTKFSADKIFRRTKFSAASRNFGSFVQRNFFTGFLFSHTIHKKNKSEHEICINLTCFRFQRTEYFGRQNFLRTKFFGG